jgi:LCP family protein required for cell wall assembly
MGTRETSESGQSGPRNRINKKVILFIVAGLFIALLVYIVLFICRVSDPSAVFENKGYSMQGAGGFSRAGAAPDSSREISSIRLLSGKDEGVLKDKVNILVLGTDRDAERESRMGFRTDTIILLVCSFKEKRVDLISFPRDSFVFIYPFKEMDRINTAFEKGGGEKNGYKYVMKTVSRQIGGLAVDYYLNFDMPGVKKIVDAIGGVDYDVDVRVTMGGRTTEKGPQHLNGQQVLDYCRMRLGSSDLERVDRQQRMLLAIFGQLKARGQLQDLPGIYSALTDNIKTNLDFTQICALALFAKDLDATDINRCKLKGMSLLLNDSDYWGIDQEEKQQMLKNIFGKEFGVDMREDGRFLKSLYGKFTALKASAEENLEDARAFFGSGKAPLPADENAAFENYQLQIKRLIQRSSTNNFTEITGKLEKAVEDFDFWYASIKNR